MSRTLSVSLCQKVWRFTDTSWPFRFQPVAEYILNILHAKEAGAAKHLEHAGNEWFGTRSMIHKHPWQNYERLERGETMT